MRELERIEEERYEKEAQKEERREAKRIKDLEKVLEMQKKEGRALFWECAKSDHLERVANWEGDGRIGPKPVRPKQKDVWDEFDMLEDVGWEDMDDS